MCEWDAGDGRVETWPLPAPSAAGSSEDGDGDGGHLAAAQARSLADRVVLVGDDTAAGRRDAYRYRFVATSASGAMRRTRWFAVAAASWSATGGRLDVSGGDRLVPGSVEWLTGPEGPRRVRFALRLTPDEHVVGFGERFDAVDQRGRTLDAVVFEQYKAQGAHGRTYLPMPFALVVGPAATWGFHVRTARRTWFDVGATTPDQLVVEADLGRRRRALRRGLQRLARVGAGRVPGRGGPARGTARVGVPAVGQRQRVEHAGPGHGRGGRATESTTSPSAPWSSRRGATSRRSPRSATPSTP